MRDKPRGSILDLTPASSDLVVIGIQSAIALRSCSIVRSRLGGSRGRMKHSQFTNASLASQANDDEEFMKLKDARQGHRRNGAAIVRIGRFPRVIGRKLR